MEKVKIIFKSVFHNIGVVFVGLCFGYIGKILDLFLNINSFKYSFLIILGIIFIFIGFIIRVWATFYFYKKNMKVISLIPQTKLITTGPYYYSRNPLYIGGNIFIFLGSVLFFESPSGIFMTIINIFLVDLMIRREEKQLEQEFGDEWIHYKNKVNRWI